MGCLPLPADSMTSQSQQATGRRGWNLRGGGPITPPTPSFCEGMPKVCRPHFKSLLQIVTAAPRKGCPSRWQQSAKRHSSSLSFSSYLLYELEFLLSLQCTCSLRHVLSSPERKQTPQSQHKAQCVPELLTAHVLVRHHSAGHPEALRTALKPTAGLYHTRFS